RLVLLQARGELGARLLELRDLLGELFLVLAKVLHLVDQLEPLAAERLVRALEIGHAHALLLELADGAVVLAARDAPGGGRGGKGESDEPVSRPPGACIRGLHRSSPHSAGRAPRAAPARPLRCPCGCAPAARPARSPRASQRAPSP